MNHLPTEEEDKSFQQGYLVAKYLDENTCQKTGCQNMKHCPDCIDTAVAFVEAATRNDEAKQAHVEAVLFSVMRQGRKKWRR